MIVVAAAVEMNAAGDRHAVLLIRGADGRPVVRHVHDGVGRRDRRLDGDRRIRVGDIDRLRAVCSCPGRVGLDVVGFGLGVIGFRFRVGRSLGIGCRLLLQPVEFFLHQPQLLFQQRYFCRTVCRLGAGLRGHQRPDHPDRCCGMFCFVHETPLLLAARTDGALFDCPSPGVAELKCSLAAPRARDAFSWRERNISAVATGPHDECHSTSVGEPPRQSFCARRGRAPRI